MIQKPEAVARRCSGEKLFLKFHKMYRQSPVSENLF